MSAASQVIAASPASAGTSASSSTGGGSDRHRIGMGRFLILTAQLALVLLVAWRFQIEQDHGLRLLAPLILGGFIVHAWLPLQLRTPAFLALSLAGIGLVFGFPGGLMLVGIGLLLIGLCHVPLPFRFRLLLVAGVGLVLFALRGGWLHSPTPLLSQLVLPMIGSMFMFRLVVYLYDLRHEKGPVSIWTRLSYFFLLPNICFPLFPVVDYQNFRRNYYDADADGIYQKGVVWMFRGVTQFLLYRVVYYYVVVPPADVHSLGQVAQSILGTYLLYLRLSGQFHFVIGILCLFGWNLPETHHLYYLASGFNDYWRRINIYWKDFMMKIFYFPAYMKLRKAGGTAALVIATALVFATTWILHSYQWFWITGTFPLAAPDALFWGILGGLVVVNSVHEARRGRKRNLGKRTFDLREATAHSAKVVGMFVFLTVLWSLWNSPTVKDWLDLMKVAAHGSAAEWARLLGVLAALIAAGVLLQYMTQRRPRPAGATAVPAFRGSALRTMAAAVVLLLAGVPQVVGLAGGRLSSFASSLQESHLNRADQRRMERGYYEQLLDADKYVSALERAHKPADWVETQDSDAVQHRSDALEYELRPEYDKPYKRSPFHVNHWGFRDQEYALAKPAHTVRFALLGASYDMGAGVDNNATYEALAEAKINGLLPGRDSLEILNFSVGAYSALHNMIQFEDKVLQFDPDVAVYSAFTSEDVRLLRHLRQLVRKGIAVPYEEVASVLRASGVTPEMSDNEMERRLQPHVDELLGWIYGRVAAKCRERGIEPVAVFVPTTTEIAGLDQARYQRFARLATDAGFHVFSLEGAYGDVSQATVRLASWDAHPNVLGHRLLADRLVEVVREHASVFRLGAIGTAAAVEAAAERY